MVLAILSLLALVLAIVIGFWKNINVGLVAIVFAFILGYYLADWEFIWSNSGATESMQLSIGELLDFWPMSLFIMTFGITFLFVIAKLNGTLEKISMFIISLSKGKKILLPIIFYVLALVIASVGPGNISTSALLLPIGIAIGYRAKISPLMISVLIINGSIAGGLSPLAPNGAVAVDLALTNGVGEMGASIYIVNVISMTIFSVLFFIAMGGLKLKGETVEIEKPKKFSKNQIITIFAILALVVWVLLGGKSIIGFAGFTLGAVLILVGAGDFGEAIKHVPWATILLICGMGVLIEVAKAYGGIELLTDALATLMNEWSAIPIMAALGGFMSIFSSAVGVVMPALIPTTVDLAAGVGGAVTASALTIAIAVGSHIVTMSPLSVMGALALANSPETIDRKKLFRDLLLTALGALLFIAIFLGILQAIGLL